MNTTLIDMRPEIVTLRECLEAHQDHENLLYLIDSEATLEDVNKWIGGGTKLILARSRPIEETS